MARRRKGLPINGILLLNKPLGLSSNKALQEAKKLYKAQKAGHTGSLDPLATGMLPVCFGEATKVCAHLLDSNKAYRAEITLGIKTTTEDGEGDITHQQVVPAYTHEQLEKVLNQFRGQISQIPPMHSALWHQGKRLYELARAGESVDVKPRTVTIHSLLKLGAIQDNKLMLDIVCSKGTYIRSLARDMGDALGCGAYMSALHRQYVEPFANHALYDLASLGAGDYDEDKLHNALLPVDSALCQYVSMVLTEEQSNDIFQGRKVLLDSEQYKDQPENGSAAQIVRIYKNQSTPDSFLGLANYESLGVISPKRLMHI